MLSLYLCVNSKHAVKQWSWIHVVVSCLPLCLGELGRGEFGEGGPSKVFLINKTCFYCEMIFNIVI